MTDDASVEGALGVIDEREGRLDVLVNNAGISSTGDVNGPVALQVFDTNAIGIIRVTQAALPLLEKSENPVVVNVSSALGSFWAVTNPERRQFHFPSIMYGASKAAVSMLTVQYAKALPDIKFNAVEPGFEHGRLVEVAAHRGGGTPAAGHHARAVADAGADPRLHVDPPPRRGERAHGGVLAQRVADPQRARLLGERVDQVAVALLGDQHPGHREAGLARVAEDEAAERGARLATGRRRRG